MTASLIEHFQILARYNTLANRKLYAACSQLDDSERKQLRPAFFKSIHGTLNHILVGDRRKAARKLRIWLGRFAEAEVPSTGLDQILHEDSDQLQAARVQTDKQIEVFAANLTEAFLARSLSYRNHQGHLHCDPVSLAVAHFFNHQTHHRGQIHDLLSQTRIAPPSLDLHRVIRPDSTTS